jgi:CDP-diacylglycerol--glycerol-3-phosphate 3-phosphatidyltransferase
VTHGVVPDRVAEGTRIGLAPLARQLHRLGITANVVTIAGGILTVIGAGLLAAGMLVPALVVLVLGTLADTLDGQLAKAAGGGTTFGAFLDSTIDRVSDAALFVGAALVAVLLGQPALLWWSLIALVASSLVPYVRAKAESLGVAASVGPAPREARIVIFLLGLGAWAIFGVYPAFAAAVLIVALLASVTLVMRVVHVGRQLQIKGR